MAKGINAGWGHFQDVLSTLISAQVDERLVSTIADLWRKAGDALNSLRRSMNGSRSLVLVGA